MGYGEFRLYSEWSDVMIGHATLVVFCTKPNWMYVPVIDNEVSCWGYKTGIVSHLSESWN